MRTDNRKVKNAIISIYFLLMVLAILLTTVFRTFDLLTNNIWYLFLGLCLTVVFVHSIARYFEYNSDGSKVILTNKGLILTDFINYRQKKVQFTRNQLIGYKIKNYLIYKLLIVTIKNGERREVKEYFNITLLKRKKTRYVKQSLKKILKHNKKHNHRDK